MTVVMPAEPDRARQTLDAMFDLRDEIDVASVKLRVTPVRTSWHHRFTRRSTTVNVMRVLSKSQPDSQSVTDYTVMAAERMIRFVGSGLDPVPRWLRHTRDALIIRISNN